MSGTRRTVLRNAGALLASQVITWSLALVLVVFLPRYLGAANVGRLIFANSLWAIAMVVVAFGMDVHLTKEIARHPERLRSLLRISFTLRGVLFIFGLAGVLIYLKLVGYPPETVLIASIVAGTSLFTLLNNACQAALQGLERMEYIALGAVAGKAVYSALAIAMLVAGFGVYAVAIVAAVGALVTLVIELRAVLRLAPVPAGSSDWSLRSALWEARRMFSASLPYVMSDAFLVAYMQADVVILSLLLDERAIGWYGAASQLFGTFLFVPTILITAIFPALSRLHATESGSTAAVYAAQFRPLDVVGRPDRPRDRDRRRPTGSSFVRPGVRQQRADPRSSRNRSDSDIPEHARRVDF